MGTPHLDLEDAQIFYGSSAEMAEVKPGPIEVAEEAAVDSLSGKRVAPGQFWRGGARSRSRHFSIGTGMVF
jgi:hypothetical protein